MTRSTLAPLSMTAVILFAVTLLAAPLHAQQQRDGARGGPGADPIGLLLEQREALELTAEQVERLEDLRAEWTEGLAEARVRMEAMRERHLADRRARMQERREAMEARDERMRERWERMEERRETMEDRRETMERRREMMGERQETMERRREMMEERRETMRERMRGRAELIRGTRGAMSDRREEHRRLMGAIRDVLTSEQLERFHELREELRPERRRPDGMGERPGPRGGG